MNKNSQFFNQNFSEKFQIINIFIILNFQKFLIFLHIFNLSHTFQNHIHKLLPYIIKNIIFGIVFLLHGILDLSFYGIAISFVFLYIFLCSFSLYREIDHKNALKLENAHVNANFGHLQENCEAPKNEMRGFGSNKTNLLAYRELS